MSNGATKWSSKFFPTGRSLTTLIPTDSRCSFGPIPDSIKICGEFIVPPDIITSFLALIFSILSPILTCTPVATFVLGSINIFRTEEFRDVNMLVLFLIFPRKALAALILRPFLILVVTSRMPSGFRGFSSSKFG